MAWGEIDYKDPETQLGMIKQYEDVVGVDFIAESDTDKLWISHFNYWTTRHCLEVHYGREDPGVRECGRDQVFPGDNSTCSGTWIKNTLGLKDKVFSGPIDECSPYSGGICRPASKLHPEEIADLGIDGTSDESYCPVFEGWSDEKFKFCLETWTELTGGGGSLITVDGTATPYEECDGEFYKDAEIVVPLPISMTPTMYAKDLYSHRETVDMISETRGYCDEDGEIHCWMKGIPFDYWEQYLTVEAVLVKVSAVAIGAGLVISFLFLFIQTRVLTASLVGGLLIAVSFVYY